MRTEDFPPVTEQKCSTVARKRTQRAVLAWCLALSTTASAATQDWTVVDEVIGGRARGIVSDDVGNIYIAGNVADPAGLTGALLLKSSDRGLTWDADPATPDAEPSLYLPGASYFFQTIASARVQIGVASFEDHTVVGGFFSYPDPAGAWIIYRSVEAGAPGSWVQIASPADFDFLGYSKPTLGSVAVDATGNVYVTGHATKTTVTTVKGKPVTSSDVRWLVYKGSRSVDSAGGEIYSWSSIPVFNQPGAGEGIACSGTDVYIAGGNGSFWEVWKGGSGGATWQRVDQFQQQAGLASSAYGIAVDPVRNRIIVAGYGKQSGRGKTEADSMIVRVGTGLGDKSFKSVDTHTASLNTRAMAVTTAPDGTVYASGWVRQIPGLVTWTTRKGTESSGVWSWTTDDSFPSASDQTSQAFGVAAAKDNPLAPGTSSGDVFAVGSASGRGSWVVRGKLTP